MNKLVSLSGIRRLVYVTKLTGSPTMLSVVFLMNHMKKYSMDLFMLFTQVDVILQFIDHYLNQSLKKDF